jgi:hypothetical protein
VIRPVTGRALGVRRLERCMSGVVGVSSKLLCACAHSELLLSCGGCDRLYRGLLLRHRRCGELFNCYKGCL